MFISDVSDKTQRIAFAWNKVEEHEGIILKTLFFAQSAEHHDAIVHQLLIAVVELVVKAVVCPAAADLFALQHDYRLIWQIFVLDDADLIDPDRRMRCAAVVLDVQLDGS